MEVARIVKMTTIIILVAFVPNWGARAQTQVGKIGNDLEDEDAVAAFRLFWKAFDEYENKLLREGKLKFQQSWSKLRSEESKVHTKFQNEKIEKLTRAARQYRTQLEQHVDVENRPFVMLSLGQVLHLLGSSLSSSTSGSGTAALDEGLMVLANLEKEFPRFSEREAALYLRALIFEAKSSDSDAISAWRDLASVANNSAYGAYALMAVGDHYFKAEQPSKALPNYKKAASLINKLPSNRRTEERVRVLYRIAWAAYRSADLDEAVSAAGDLLSPEAGLTALSQKELIQKDAAELMGDALYENADMGTIKEVISRSSLMEFAPVIGLRVLDRYSANDVYESLTEVGEFLAEKFPLAVEIPRILNHLALGFEKTSRTTRRMAALERLALLLPKDSLWRSRHRDKFSEIKRMEDLASTSAKLVANWHYDQGIGSGSQRSFNTAAAFYSILLENDPNGADASKWRLRQGHSNYFSDRLETASRIYSSIKEEFRGDEKDLQIAAYQLVLAKEKIWRQHYAEAVNRGEDPLKDEASLTAISELQRVVDEFANKYSGQSRAVDVILVGASAYRDQGKYADAAKMWQRVLLSNPSKSQRSSAIRGMIFAAMKDGTSADVITAARRFLKLEDWESLGSSLSSELEGILSVAALDEGKKLNQDGKLAEAGYLLVGIAKDFPKLPNRAKIYRDGAYTLALAGDWTNAGKAANDFLQSNIKELRGDMLYLQARSYEFLMRFHDASAAYLELGSKFPDHSRSEASLQRAEQLALAEDKLEEAGQAAEIMGGRAKDRSSKLRHYERAFRHFAQGNAPQRAKNAAESRLRISQSRGEKLSSRLLVASMQFKMGEEDLALDSYKKIAAEADRYRSSIGDTEWAAISGEAHFLLGEDSRAQFDDFSLVGRTGDEEENIRLKTGYFAKLSSSYQKSSETGQAEWAAPARFRIAQAAATFADEIASIASRQTKLTLKSQARYQEQVKRLRELARNYHSKNIAAKAKEPGKYLDNDWIRKSALSLGGLDPSGGKIKHVEKLPEATHLELPYQWSL